MAKRTRSPNYPALDLGSAVEAIKRVYETGFRSMEPEDVAEAIGHQSLSGSARVKVSALRKYGLLEPEGDSLRLSDGALSIVNLPPEDPEHKRALHTAALRPALFTELHETYKDTEPSDGLLRNYLLKRDFSPNAANEVIRVYRSTMDLVAAPEEGYTAADEPGDGPDEEQQEKRMQQREKAGGGGGSGGSGALAFDVPGTVARQQHYGLSEDRDVYLLFVGEQPTKEDIATLKDYLDIFEKRLPSDSSDSANAASSDKLANDNGAAGENGQHE